MWAVTPDLAVRLSPAEEVGDRVAVVVEAATHRAAAATDVAHDRNVRFLEQRPESVVIGVRRRHDASWQVGRHHHRRAPFVDRPARTVDRPLRDPPRDGRHGEQARVVGAEGGHRPVERVGAGVEGVEIVAGELRRGERREHQLCRETERVEHVAALTRIERPDGPPALRPQQRERVVVERDGTGRRSFRRLGDRLGGECSRLAERQWPQPLAGVGVSELLQPSREFHDMTVGVEHDAIPCIRHA